MTRKGLRSAAPATFGIEDIRRIRQRSGHDNSRESNKFRNSESSSIWPAMADTAVHQLRVDLYLPAHCRPGRGPDLKCVARSPPPHLAIVPMHDHLPNLQRAHQQLAPSQDLNRSGSVLAFTMFLKGCAPQLLVCRHAARRDRQQKGTSCESSTGLISTFFRCPSRSSPPLSLSLCRASLLSSLVVIRRSIMAFPNACPLRSVRLRRPEPCPPQPSWLRPPTRFARPAT